MKFDTKVDSDGIKANNTFTVVGIGAASGSLDALKEIVAAIKKNPCITYLIALCLSQEEELQFKDILGKYSVIPVVDLRAKVPVTANHIYLISKNSELVAKDGALEVIEHTEAGDKNSLFDHFFTCLATVYRESAVGVLLSGEGTDGTKGLIEIKDHGGVSIAQNPTTSVHREMPENAINAGAVDLVTIPGRLIHQVLAINNSLQQPRTPGEGRFERILTDNIFEQIYGELIKGRSPDFAFYDQVKLRQSVHQRIEECHLINEADYLNYLKGNVQELELLSQILNLSETAFFRNPEVFEYLEKTVYPELIRNKSTDIPLRIWIAGCSTGQEVYSFAISIVEFLEKEMNMGNIRVQIFATDISEAAIEKAKIGTYDKNELEGLSLLRISDYFTEVEEVYTIGRTLRNLCTFAVHDFLKEPPFSKIDLISCRNVLSSMDIYWQKKAYSVFRHVIAETGFLIIGRSEPASMAVDLFSFYHKIYRILAPKQLTEPSLGEAVEGSLAVGTGLPLPLSEGHQNSDIVAVADQVLLSNFTPPAVVINGGFEIIQIRGVQDRRVFTAPAKVGLNILELLPSTLAEKLAKAKKQVEQMRFVYEEEIINLQDQADNLVLQVVPLSSGPETYYLVLLLDEDLRSLMMDKGRAVKIPSDPPLSRATESESLKVLNVELEAKTEELESVQVELVSTNQELLERNEKLDQYRNMTEAIISTLHESFLILDEEFIIQSVNQTFLRHFKCKESEVIGRLIFDIQDKGWNVPGLKAALGKIRDKESPYFNLEVSFVFPKVGLQDVCFILKPIYVQGSGTLYLVALEDLTTRRINERNIALAKDRQTYYDFFMQTPAAICILMSRDFIFEFANPAFIQLIGERNPLGKSIRVAIGELGEEYFRIFENVYDTKTPYVGKEIPVLLKDVNGGLKRRYLNITCQVFKDISGESEGVMVFLYDITDLIRAQSKISQNESNLKRILEDLPVMTWTNLPDGRVTFYNQKWYNYTGVNFDEEQWGGWKSIIHPDDLSKTLRTFKRALNNGVNFEIENRYRRSDGVYRWHLNRAIPIYIEDEISIWVGTATDINEQKISEQKKDEFLSIASHEMKTPLTTATAYIQLIEQNLQPSEGDHRLYANKALTSMRKLNDLIAELLDVSKIHHGKLAYNIEELDFNNVINNSIESIHYVSPEYMIIKEGEVRYKIKGDKSRLQQVLVNLLSNAVKYSPDHQVIWVNVTEENDEVIVKIRDQGIGINKDDLDKIFDRYYRVNQQDAIKFQGLGIGLYISNEIISRHGGKLWAESTYGQGSIFCFSIPF